MPSMSEPPSEELRADGPGGALPSATRSGTKGRAASNGASSSGSGSEVRSVATDDGLPDFILPELDELEALTVGGAASAPAEALADPDPDRELEAERARLLAAIAGANERILAARSRTAVREAEAREALRAEIEAARRTVAEMEGRHRNTLAAIRYEASVEVDRILDEARRLVAGGEPVDDGGRGAGPDDH